MTNSSEFPRPDVHYTDWVKQPLADDYDELMAEACLRVHLALGGTKAEEPGPEIVHYIARAVDEVQMYRALHTPEMQAKIAAIDAGEERGCK